MEDDTTKDLSFGDKLDRILDRLNALEAKTFDTRPIWERALSEIIEVKAQVIEVKAQVIEVKTQVIDIHTELGDEIISLKTDLRKQGHKFDVLVQHLISTQTDVKDLEERLLRIEGNQTQG